MGTTQRFCLRWNNHQSNLLSVFDQLLHDEAFVDVTLAVEGQFLRAHKMVLSACSPYFQSLFVGHPDRHPIVILKDVPYADMRSLLDFMYRGEVSVDQERLTAFLKVAETLRIKGLTEVNEERCPDLPAIASSLLSNSSAGGAPPPPPSLHRIHPLSHKRVLAPLAANPLLGSALTAPKRKRGRPRKLSGSSNGPNTGDDESNEHELRLHHPNRTDSPVMGPPDLLEVNMGGDSDHNPNHTDDDPIGIEPEDEDNKVDHSSEIEEVDEKPIKQEPTPGPSNQDSTFKTNHSKEEDHFSPDQVGMLRLVPHSELMDPKNVEGEEGCEGEGSGESTAVAERDTENNNDSFTDEGKVSPGEGGHFVMGQCFSEPPPPRPAQSRRRFRRRATSSSDPAEQLTEMSVRGLNLFRYASVSEGVYKCMECEKADILKTFKNKYSFQRHAFLYHEGHQRKVFPCPVCSKEFSRPDKMKNHMKTVHDCFMPKDCVFPPPDCVLPPGPMGFLLPP